MNGRDVASELANMAANLEQKTGRSMSARIEVVLASGKAKHAEMISYLKDQHRLGHGYANLVAQRRSREGGWWPGCRGGSDRRPVRRQGRPSTDLRLTDQDRFEVRRRCRTRPQESRGQPPTLQAVRFH